MLGAEQGTYSYYYQYIVGLAVGEAVVLNTTLTTQFSLSRIVCQGKCVQTAALLIVCLVDMPTVFILLLLSWIAVTTSAFVVNVNAKGTTR